jgi:hypothetical protein
VEPLQVGRFLDAALPALGIFDETAVVSQSLPPIESWLPGVLESMGQSAGGLNTMDAADGSVSGEFGGSASSSQLAGDRAREQEGDERLAERCSGSFARLLADALVEIAQKEEKTGPRMLGWRRQSFGEPPLSRFDRDEGKTTVKQTWERVRHRLDEVVKIGGRSAEGASVADGDSAAAVSTVGGASEEAEKAQTVNLMNIDENIEALLEEEITSDEASWLDISADAWRVIRASLLVLPTLVNHPVAWVNGA